MATTYLDCPFTPIGAVMDSTWELRLNEGSAACPEISIVSVYGSDSLAVIDSHEITVEVTFRAPGDITTNYSGYFRADFYDGSRCVADGDYMSEITSGWPFTVGVIPSGSVFVTGFAINRLKTYGFSEPIPETTTQLYRFAYVTPGGYVQFEILNVQFLRSSPAANIFWTANKGCTEMP